MIGRAGCVVLLCAALPAHADLSCGTPPFDDQPRLASTYDRIAGAVSGFPALGAALSSDLTLCLDDTLFEARGYFEPDTRRITLSSALSDGLSLAVAVHELRHMQQFDGGQCPSLDLSMQAYAEFVFAMEADASVTSIVVAHALREDGDTAMWQALTDWPMQGDLAGVFEARLTETDDLNHAAAATFAAWYDNPARQQAYYVASCMEYLEQLEKDHLRPRYGALPEGLYADLCRLPDGQSYDCRRQVDQDRP